MQGTSCRLHHSKNHRGRLRGSNPAEARRTKDAFRRDHHRQRLRGRDHGVPAVAGGVPGAGARARPAVGQEQLPAQAGRPLDLEPCPARIRERLARPADVPRHGRRRGRRGRRRVAHLRQHLLRSTATDLRPGLVPGDHLPGAEAALRYSRGVHGCAARSRQPVDGAHETDEGWSRRPRPRRPVQEARAGCLVRPQLDLRKRLRQR